MPVVKREFLRALGGLDVTYGQYFLKFGSIFMQGFGKASQEVVAGLSKGGLGYFEQCLVSVSVVGNRFQRYYCACNARCGPKRFGIENSAASGA